MRIAAWACVGVLIVALAAALILVPKAEQAIDTMNTLSAELSAVDWEGLAASMKELAETGQATLAQLDIDGLNKAVSDLQKAVAPLAKLFG